MSIALPLISDEVLAESLSVVEHPDPMHGNALRFGYVTRGPLLPSKGSREREWKLRQYDHHDYNTMFRSVKAGIVKRIQSTPWEIAAKDADRWQRMLMNADSGDWERFVSKVVDDFLVHDTGAWVEFIAPGDPRFPPTGGVVGFAVLDTLRVYPTGNPTYPAIYYNRKGKLHLLHRSRVHHMVDSEDSEEDLAGYGESALSRAIAPVHREILMNRYIEQFLDDKPTPGIMVVNNIGKDAFESALRRMRDENRVDAGGDWGEVVQLFGLDPAEKSTVDFYSNTKAPEKFDYVEYINVEAKQMAAAIGVDIQEFWELSGQGIGSGTQSEVLAQKSRGKIIGRLLKAFERMFNRALPEDAEFSFKYKDPQEDAEQANKAQVVVNVVQLALASGSITPDEGRIILASQVEMFKDALIDADGNIKRLPDDDPKSVEQIAGDADSTSNPIQQLVDAAGTPASASPLQSLVDAQAAPASPLQAMMDAAAQKSLDQTAADFERRFSNFVRVGQAQNFNTAILRTTFRDELLRAGEMAFDDGLRDGGADPLEADAVDRADHRRKVAEWLALQNTFVTNFVNDVADRRISPDQIPMRASMWVNKSLRSIYYVGLKDAAGEKFYSWGLGSTIAHCQSCLLLAGQVHKLKDWMRTGWMPGCTCLECKGYQCDCRLSETRGPARGRLPQSSSTTSLIDRFVGFFKRNAGKSLMVEVHPDALGRFVQRMAA